jgi:hypothetical protein
MTKLRAVVLLAVVALLLFPAAAFAQNPPELPCRFYGTVALDGEDVPDGTVVKAVVSGTEFTTTTPAAGYGPSSYAVLIEQPDGATYDGASVTFTIGGEAADQTATWISGGNVNTDVSSGEATTPVGGSPITSVVANSLPAGSAPTASLAGGVLTLGIPAGAAGADGAAGAAGAAGADGEDASGGVALPVIALVIAIIAVGMAAMGMRRRV